MSYKIFRSSRIFFALISVVLINGPTLAMLDVSSRKPIQVGSSSVQSISNAKLLISETDADGYDIEEEVGQEVPFQKPVATEQSTSSESTPNQKTTEQNASGSIPKKLTIGKTRSLIIPSNAHARPSVQAIKERARIIKGEYHPNRILVRLRQAPNGAALQSIANTLNNILQKQHGQLTKAPTIATTALTDTKITQKVTINGKVVDVSISTITPAPLLRRFREELNKKIKPGEQIKIGAARYRNVGEIPDDIAFRYAYQQALPVQQSIYRNAVINITGNLKVDVKNIAAQLKSNPSVENTGLDYTVQAFFVPNDPLYVQQYALKKDKINAEETWDNENAQGSGVTVAVLDTGLAWDHPDIDDNVKINQGENTSDFPNNIDDDMNGYIDDIIGWNFVGYSLYDGQPQWDPYDDGIVDAVEYIYEDDELIYDFDYLYHGTHTSGVVAAKGNNGLLTVGTSFQAKILPLKVLDFFGFGSTFDIANAIIYAADNGANIINLSLGGDYRKDGLSALILGIALDYAQALGCIVVAAAGNGDVDINNARPESPDEYISLPAGHPGVIAAAATEETDKRTYFSNWGERVDVAAPGQNIVSLRGPIFNFPSSPSSVCKNCTGPAPRCSSNEVLIPNACTVCAHCDPVGHPLNGTSFSSPLTAGVAALLLSKFPTLTRSQITEAIKNTADLLTLGTSCRNCTQPPPVCGPDEVLVPQSCDRCAHCELSPACLSCPDSPPTCRANEILIPQTCKSCAHCRLAIGPSCITCSDPPPTCASDEVLIPQHCKACAHCVPYNPCDICPQTPVCSPNEVLIPERCSKNLDFRPPRCARCDLRDGSSSRTLTAGTGRINALKALKYFDPKGAHQTNTCLLVSGWACDASDYSASVQVDILDGQNVLGSVTADKSRDNTVAAQCGGNPNHGFSFKIPFALRQDGANHNITVKARNIGAGLQDSVVLMDSPKSFVCNAADYNPRGTHESSDCTNTLGFACDPDDFDLPLEVKFFKDKPQNAGGTLIGTASANVPKGTPVADQCGGNPNHGFSFDTLATLKDGVPHKIFSYATNLQAGTIPSFSLVDTPKTIKCGGVSTNGLVIDLNAKSIDGDFGNFADNTDRNTTWQNLAANSNHAALYNFPYPLAPSTPISGWNGENIQANPSVLNFDGMDDHAIIPHSNLLNTPQLTTSLWLKTMDLLGHDNVILVKGISTASPRDFLFEEDNNLTFKVNTSSSSKVSEGRVADNNWHNLVGTCDGTSLRMYIDGERYGNPVPAQRIPSIHPIGINGLGTASPSRISGAKSIANVNIYNTALSDVQVRQNYLALVNYFPPPAPRPSVNRSGLVLELTANNIDGMGNSADNMDVITAWNDLSNNLNNGTLKNFTLPANSNSGWDNLDVTRTPSLKFDGSNDYVEVRDSVSLSPTSQITVTAWVNQGSELNSRAIASKWDYRSDGSWALQVDDSDHEKFKVLIASAPSDSGLNYAVTPGESFDDKVWNFVAFTFNGSQVGNSNRLKVYVNGTQQPLSFVGNIPSKILDSKAPLRIGDFQNRNQFWKGKIANVRIYNRTLSATEVWNNYYSEGNRF